MTAAAAAEHTTGTGAYDLQWDSTDRNGIPVNVRWVHPVAPPCGNFEQANPAGTPPCVDNAKTLSHDGPVGFWATAICSLPNFAVAGAPRVEGHLNWPILAAYLDATASGVDWSPPPAQDGDYSIDIVPAAQSTAALEDNEDKTEAADGSASRVTVIHAEFDSRETVTRFHTRGWWAKLQDLAVNHHWPELTSMVRNRAVVVIGQFGVDVQHGAAVESHPVFAFALDENATIPVERWAFFVRSSGNEGYCSHKPHLMTGSADNTFVLRLPWLAGATNVRVTVPQDQSSANDGAAYVDSRSVPGDGVYLVFRLPAAAKHGSELTAPRVAGEAILSWSAQPGVQLKPRKTATELSKIPLPKTFLPLHASAQERSGDTDEGIVSLLRSLPPAQQKDIDNYAASQHYRADPVGPASSAIPSTTEAMLQGKPLPPGSSVPSMRPTELEDTTAAARSDSGRQVICRATGGNIPKLPHSADLCRRPSDLQNLSTPASPR